MKKRVFIASLFVLISFFSFIGTTFAVTTPSLLITSNKYSEGDKMTKDDVNSLKVKGTLQLYAVIGIGNDLCLNKDNCYLGWYADEVNLTGVTWSSSDSSIATVSSTGLVTAVKKGNVVITASYTGSEVEDTEEYNLEIQDKVNPDTGANFNIGIIGIGIIGISAVYIIAKKNKKVYSI